MKATLLLLIHFHQPVGNFDNVIRRVYDRCYKPFLDAVSQHPGLKMSMHFSGCLLEWFEKNTPEVLEVIGRMVKTGQVELVGGGFYEPILPIIPERDRQGQISLMQRYIKGRFKTEARGAWVAERVWEPELVSTLAKSGVEYIVLDDMHFLYAGVRKEGTYGYFISEDNGSSVRIFPSDKELRYAIPFGEPDKPISYMRRIAESRDGAIFTYGDDAEKFGEWPGTYKWVYEDKWLARFLGALSDNSGWLVTRTFSECIKDSKPLGRIYLPTASYEEMLEWALPPDASEALAGIKEELKRENRYERYGPFIRGGFFRNFLAKYSESNQMHKRMLDVSNLLGARNEFGVPLLKEARAELYRSQCNCAYWHGIFGGLYLYHLRKSIYEHLLKAENVYNEYAAGRLDASEKRSEVIDFDADGFDEVILQNKDIWLCAKPSSGGSIVELDVRNRAVNILNVLTRRRELYHKNITAPKEAADGDGMAGGDGHVSIHDKAKSGGSLAAALIYDRHGKAMLLDHFFKEGTTEENFAKEEYAEDSDFLNASYEFSVKNCKNNSALSMARNGTACGGPASIRKDIVLSGQILKISYRITNKDGEKRQFWFGTEMAFIMPDADSSRYAYVFGKKKEKDLTLLSRGSVAGIKELKVTDSEKELGLDIAFSKECDLWRFPIKTVSQSEKAYEENYQGSVIVPSWRFLLEPDKYADLEIVLSMVTT